MLTVLLTRRNGFCLIGALPRGPLVSRPVLAMEPWLGTKQACGALQGQQTTFNSSSAAAERGASLVFVYRTLQNHFGEVFCCTNVG